MGSGDKAFCTKHNLEILKINGKVNIGFQIPKEKKATRYTLYQQNDSVRLRKSASSYASEPKSLTYLVLLIKFMVTNSQKLSVKREVKRSSCAGYKNKVEFSSISQSGFCWPVTNLYPLIFVFQTLIFMMRSSFMFAMVCIVFVFTFRGQVAEATRKLPFNGSIFGKRSNQGM